MKPEIFKAYDIRGTYPDQLDADAARAIGRGVARFLGTGPVVVGRDMRESGIALREGLVAGLRAEGLDVIDVGRVSTPMVYFATTSRGAGGGVMITASHNPGAYNGFKLCGRNAVPIGIETGLVDVRAHAERLHGAALPAPRGALASDGVREDYYRMLLDAFPARPRLSCVIDAGNGIAGEALAGLLDRLALDATRLYFEPDGSFPNHEADPLKLENLEALQHEVRRRGADLGIAFDGDGDRAVFVDENAEPVPADLSSALFAREVLGQGLMGAKAGEAVVYDLRSSRVVAEEIRRAGGRPVRSRVGHAFIKKTMRDEGACFGGELSGHYYFRLPGGYVADDGAAAMMLMLQVLESSGRRLSELWSPLRRYAQSGEINRRVADVAEVTRRVRAAFPDGKADDLDGLTVQYDDWWFNLRPSNTEPLLRLNVEAQSPAEMLARRDQLAKIIDG
jgi:phosphomannomutase